MRQGLAEMDQSRIGSQGYRWRRETVPGRNRSRDNTTETGLKPQTVIMTATCNNLVAEAGSERAVESERWTIQVG